jgi:hypothetical protein
MMEFGIEVPFKLIFFVLPQLIKKEIKHERTILVEILTGVQLED